MKKPGKVENNNASEESLLVSCDRVSSERYQAFIESIEEGVYEVDLQGNFLYFNNSFCRVLGYPGEEVQFQNFSKFMSPAYAKKALETFNRIHQTGKGFSDLMWKFKAKNGEIRMIELSANLIVGNGDEPVGFRGIARDVTSRFETQRALEASERRFRTLLDFMLYPIVVFTLDRRVSYLNPAFTKTFGWTLTELAGKKVPYIPAHLEKEVRETREKLLRDRVILRQETQRLTKDGRILDVVFSVAVYSEIEGKPSGFLALLRDISHEKRIQRNNEALLRTSLAFPEYSDLDHLLSYISGEIKNLLEAEGALVILLDEENGELYFKSAAHDDLATEKRAKEVRYPADKGVAGKVIRTGKPVLLTDVSKDPDYYSTVDMQAGFKTKNMLDVPLRSDDRIIGVLCVINKKRGDFDETDIEVLNTISGTVALSIENARFRKALTESYKEVSSLSRAKDKVINHLSHELKTPVAVLGASLNILGKRLGSLPEARWEPTLKRAKRNLDRILQLQYEVEDIMQARHYDAHHLISVLLEECIDVLESFVAEDTGEGVSILKLRKRIDDIFLPKQDDPEEILLDRFVSDTMETLKAESCNRNIDFMSHLGSVPPILLPAAVLKKIVFGLIKNAIENTPDSGKIEVNVQAVGESVELVVRDYGVGITGDNQSRIFEGFWVTQNTMDYSSKRPFDFNAGGKGADLLRMKIFSERYNFKIDMISSRCQWLSMEKDLCPGDIAQCRHCKAPVDCYHSGGAMFTVVFPSVREIAGKPHN